MKQEWFGNDFVKQQARTSFDELSPRWCRQGLKKQPVDTPIENTQLRGGSFSS